MSLKSQILSTPSGSSFITSQSRISAYTAAKRAGVSITTEETDQGTKVTITSDITSKIDPLTHATVMVKDLSTADRLTLFESFELCCGMNRGECICAIPIEQPRPVVDMTDPLASFIAKAQAKKGITQDIPVVATVEARPVDQWIGWSDEQIERQDGQKITFRVHIKSKKVREIRRESDLDSFA